MKEVVITLSLVFALQMSFSQNKITKEKKQNNICNIIIQTNGDCHSCKEKIEMGLIYEKGIRDVDYDIKTSKITVKYNAKKTNHDVIRNVINQLGYDADDKKADKRSNVQDKQHQHH